MFPLLENELETYCGKNRLSGMLRITCKDKILLQQSFGYANLEEKTPFTKDSLFTLYSISKPFCAIGLLLLADQGLLSLEEHPGSYLPEAKGFDRRVTMQQLLQHTSGLPDFSPTPGYMADYAPGYAHKCREHLEILSRYPNYFDPGTDTHYSNIGYMISALIIENLSGLPYADYMKAKVFDPLGMNTAAVDNENLVLPNRVQGYTLEEDRVIPTQKSHSWMLGGGDLVGTMEDVYCLNKAIKHRLLLKPETWEQALTPSPVSSKGFGCSITQWHGKHRITHNGGHRGFRTLHIQLPEDDFDLIFLSNSGYCNPARSEIAEMIYRAFYDADAEAEAPLQMDNLPI